MGVVQAFENPNGMTLDELIAALQKCREAVGGDCEVIIWTHWADVSPKRVVAEFCDLEKQRTVVAIE